MNGGAFCAAFLLWVYIHLEKKFRETNKGRKAAAFICIFHFRIPYREQR
jgi:hypothetical protein